MTGVVRRVVAVAVAVALGVGVGVLTWSLQAPERQREELYGDPGDRVRTAVEALQSDPVHVTPDGRPLLAEADAEAISATIRDRDLPVYVVVWEPSDAAGYESPIQAGEQITWALTQATGEPAAVVIWGAGTNGRLDTTPDWVWRPEVDLDQRDPEFLGDAAPRLTEWLDGLPDGGEPLREIDDGLPVAGGIALGVLAAATALGLLWAALALAGHVLRRRR